LTDEADKAVYAMGSGRVAVSGELAGLLLEGLLIDQGKTMPVGQVGTHPALFPFYVSLNSHGLRQSPRFEAHRQGLDMDVVSLVIGHQRLQSETAGTESVAARELASSRSLHGLIGP